MPGITNNYIILTIILVIFVLSRVNKHKKPPTIYDSANDIAVQTTNGSVVINKNILANDIRNIKSILAELKIDSNCDMLEMNQEMECADIKAYVISAINNMKQFVLDNGINKERLYIITYKIHQAHFSNFDSNSPGDSNSADYPDDNKKTLQHLFTELFMFMDYTSMILEKKKANDIKGSLNLQHLDELTILLFNDSFDIVANGSDKINDTEDYTEDDLANETSLFIGNNRSSFREYNTNETLDMASDMEIDSINKISGESPADYDSESADQIVVQNVEPAEMIELTSDMPDKSDVLTKDIYIESDIPLTDHGAHSADMETISNTGHIDISQDSDDVDPSNGQSVCYNPQDDDDDLDIDAGIYPCEDIAGVVFFDLNNNGCQDAGETNITEAVTVNLYECDVNGDPNGGPVASTTTLTCH